MSDDKAHESADKSVTNVHKSASNFDAIFRKKFKELKDDQESKGNSRRDLPRDGRVGKDQRVGAVPRTTSEGKDR
jgi:hypothetical protein